MERRLLINITGKSFIMFVSLNIHILYLLINNLMELSVFEEFKEMNFILMLITNIDCVLSSMVLLMGILKVCPFYFSCLIH